MKKECKKCGASYNPETVISGCPMCLQNNKDFICNTPKNKPDYYYFKSKQPKRTKEEQKTRLEIFKKSHEMKTDHQQWRKEKREIVRSYKLHKKKLGLGFQEI